MATALVLLATKSLVQARMPLLGPAQLVDIHLLELVPYNLCPQRENHCSHAHGPSIQGTGQPEVHQ